MRRVVGAVLAAGLLFAVPLAGCGIPGATPVTTHGAGPSPGIGGGEDTAPVHMTREATVDKAQFVANFLEAAAGESTQLVTTFLAPSVRDTFKSTTSEILVIHLTEQPLINPGNVEVVLRGQPVGVLGRDGVLNPPTTAQVLEYRLRVEEIVAGNGLYVTAAPSMLLTTDEAVERFYERRPIYFWNADRTRLVPDIRYMPKEVPVERQPNEIIDWLIAGPAPWLDSAVLALPDGTKRPDNVPAAVNGKLQINLGGPVVQPGDQKAVDQLSEQLRWSLQPNLSRGELELKIDQQLRGTYSGDTYLQANAAWRAETLPERFCVVGGQVRRMRTSLHPVDPVPVIDDADNHDIRYAALIRADPTGYAALVTEEGGKPYLRVGSAVPGRETQFSNAALPSPAGRPVWSAANAADDGRPGGASGMVVAGGQLFGFASDQPEPRVVEWQEAPPGSITAVAVAPDGARIAVIAAGQLYVAAVLPGGAGQRIGPPRAVGAQMRDLSAVDWSSESSVVVAGVRKDTARVALSDVSIDGVSQVYRLPDLGTFAVGYLAAYPANPVAGNGDAADAVAYVAENNLAYDALTSPQRIEADDVAGPLPSPGANVPQPTAPFFLAEVRR